MKFTRLCAVVAALLVSASPVLAQQGQQIGPAPAGKRWIAVVIAMFLIICTAVASFMTPKRGHQD